MLEGSCRGEISAKVLLKLSEWRSCPFAHFLEMELMSPHLPHVLSAPTFPSLTSVLLWMWRRLCQAVHKPVLKYCLMPQDVVALALLFGERMALLITNLFMHLCFQLWIQSK